MSDSDKERRCRRRLLRGLIALAALLYLAGAAPAQAPRPETEPSPTGEGALTPEELQALERFAAGLAPEDGEAYARAWNQGLLMIQDMKSAEAATAAAGPDGSVEADPRYQANLERMVGRSDDKIWGGERVPAGLFPEAVAVLGNNELCTGVVIDSNVVLTAAHCVCDGASERVLVGERISSLQPNVAVAETKMHIDCAAARKEGDLALLVLAEDLAVRPAEIARTEWIDAAAEIRAVGFGATGDAAMEPSGIKRQVDVPVTSAACSGDVVTAFGARSDTDYYGCGRGREMVAGQPRLDRDTCHGDSGGPVYVTGPDGGRYLAAVTSRGVGRTTHRPCGDGGIYTRLDGAHLRWIEEHAGVEVKLAAMPAPPARAGAERPTGRVASTLLAPRPTSERLEETAPGANRPARQVVGRIEDLGDDTLVLVPDDAAHRPLLLANAGTVTPAMVGAPIRATVRPENERSVTLESATLAAVADWREKSADLPRARFRGVFEAFEDLDAATEAAFRPGAMAMPGLEEALRSGVKLSEKEIVKAYGTLEPGEDELREILVERFAAATRQSKAFYSYDDRYRPRAYERIFNNSRGGVALSRKGREKEPFCSGVLISDDLVLTALHCLDLLPEEISVVFDLEEDLRGEPLDPKIFSVAEIIESRDDTFPQLDFALLRLKPYADGRQAGDVCPAQCLSTFRLDRGHPIYVVGHPQGDPRLIADNAFVYFPFRVVRKTQLNRLRLLIELELRDDPKERERRLGQFDRSYRKEIHNGREEWRNYSLRWGGQPTLGADCDTFEGNSGSPVYSRERHRVVGVLMKGEPDLSTPWRPGWRRHEAILPVGPIVEQLDVLVPGWEPEACADPNWEPRECLP